MSYYIESKSYDPYQNIALEKYLFDTCGGTPFLYLWQNKKTIVVGKWQNLFEECNMETAKELGVTICRRYTGGGAVYHDVGNLNFSFIMNKEKYDVKKQLFVIIKALKNLGIIATFSGRNDLLVCDKKFSGNAFLETKNICMHHGTILVNENKDIINQVLTSKPTKLQSKGVKSIKSRIINLSEIVPSITVNKIKEEIIKVFSLEYGNTILLDIKKEQYEGIKNVLTSKKWLFSQNPTYNIRIVGRTSFGEMDFYLNIKDKVITHAKVYSDTLDNSIVPFLESYLVGKQVDFVPENSSAYFDLLSEVKCLLKTKAL